jgi:transposase
MKKGSSKSKQNLETPTPRRRKYDEEFKRQAVAMVRNGQPVRSVAQALGISENVLHRWKREAVDSQSNSELEVEKLRQRLKQVEMERDILKKDETDITLRWRANTFHIVIEYLYCSIVLHFSQQTGLMFSTKDKKRFGYNGSRRIESPILEGIIVKSVLRYLVGRFFGTDRNKNVCVNDDGTGVTLRLYRLAHIPTMRPLWPLESFLTCLRSNHVLAYPSISLGLSE